MWEGTASRVMVADRPYGEFYDFYSVSPEYFGAELDNFTHETTTTSAHRPPTFTVHDKQHNQFCLQVNS
jgi:hypothetical protein